MLVFYQVATRLSLTTCRQVVELQDDNKSVELNNLVASCQQAVDNLSTSWKQAVRTHPVDKLLEQHCLFNLCVLTCVSFDQVIFIRADN
jgi:hypothetical protein